MKKVSTCGGLQLGRLPDFVHLQNSGRHRIQAQIQKFEYICYRHTQQQAKIESNRLGGLEV